MIFTSLKIFYRLVSLVYNIYSMYMNTYRSSNDRSSRQVQQAFNRNRNVRRGRRLSRKGKHSDGARARCCYRYFFQYCGQLQAAKQRASVLSVIMILEGRLRPKLLPVIFICRGFIYYLRTSRYSATRGINKLVISYTNR